MHYIYNTQFLDLQSRCLHESPFGSDAPTSFQWLSTYLLSPLCLQVFGSQPDSADITLHCAASPSHRS